jgi:stage V sporulation protein R
MEIANEFGLEMYPIDFEVVQPTMMHEFAAYGIPGHYSHWTYGRSFRQLKTQYDHGLSRIYEMVINSDPSRAYLLENNAVITNLMVAAHVCGHVDYFKNNHLFLSTPKDMPEASSFRSTRIREYEQQYGKLLVEQFLDAALTMSSNVDPFTYARKSKAELIADWKKEYNKKPQQEETEFDDFWKKMGRQAPPQETLKRRLPIPLHPDHDILGFVRDFAPDLEDWQRDVLDIVREEAYYFYPQLKTKMTNEGWAVFWHKQIMHEMAKRGHLSDEEAESWWILHSAVARPDRASVSPYWVGMVMWEWIFDYFNGKVTDQEKKWLEENDWTIHPKYEGPLVGSPGLIKMREVMQTTDSESLIRNWFNWVTANRMNLYLYDSFEDDGEELFMITSTDWEQVKDYLLEIYQITRGPYLEVLSGDFQGKGELLIRHQFEGLVLDANYIEKTLKYWEKIWGRPVHLITTLDKNQVRFTSGRREPDMWNPADSV